MALIIVLIVFILVFGTMGVVFYLWWKKYGKKIFDMVLNLQNMGSKTPNIGSNTSNLPNMGDIQQQMKTFTELMKKMGKK